MDEITRIDRKLAGLHHQYQQGQLSRLAYTCMADELLEQRIEQAGRSLIENASLTEFGEADTGQPRKAGGRGKEQTA